MCLAYDSFNTHCMQVRVPEGMTPGQTIEVQIAPEDEELAAVPVSYTHLTLPTIYSV